MNHTELHQKLIAVARANPPSDRVPYAFEKRIMARLQAPAPFDLGALWSRLLWRATAPALALMVLMGVCSLAVRPSDDPADQLAAALGNPVLLAVDHFDDER